MARRRSQAIRKPQETAEQIERRIVAERTTAIGLSVPALRLVEMVPVTTKLTEKGQVVAGKTVRRVIEPLERLRASGAITESQYAAGDWWREAKQAAGLVPRGRQGYEPRAGEVDHFARLLPTTERAARNRRLVRECQKAIGAQRCSVLDLYCVDGAFSGSGSAGQRNLVLFRLALDSLSFMLKLTHAAE